MSKSHQLFESFTKPDKAEWTKAASAEINGGNPAEELKWVTSDNLTFQPYYGVEDVARVSYLQKFLFTAANPWSAVPRYWASLPMITISEEAKANAEALHHLEKEAEGVLFRTDRATVNFGVLLNTIAWENCFVSFRVGQEFDVSTLYHYLEKQGADRSRLQGAIFWEGKAVKKSTPSSFPYFYTAGIVIDASTPVKEIAEALTSGVDAIETFLKAGLTLQEAIRPIAFSLPVGPQLLVEVAKLKVLRMLWYQVVQAYGLTTYQPDDLHLHARSERWINEKFQPHGNMLKSTVAAIAAVSGGANAVTVEPEDETNTMMARIARNTSTILKEESQFGKVNDPFAGAYGVEVIADQLAREAWRMFQSNQH